MTDTPDSAFSVMVSLDPNNKTPQSMGLKTVNTWGVQITPSYVERPTYGEAVTAMVGNLRSYADFLETNFLKGTQ